MAVRVRFPLRVLQKFAFYKADFFRTRRVTQSVGGVSGDLSALFQMCSVATQPSLS